MTYPFKLITNAYVARSATADNTFAEPDVKGNERTTRKKVDTCLTLFETRKIELIEDFLLKLHH